MKQTKVDDSNRIYKKGEIILSVLDVCKKYAWLMLATKNGKLDHKNTKEIQVEGTTEKKAIKNYIDRAVTYYYEENIQ